jgi:hypothetical protein
VVIVLLFHLDITVRLCPEITIIKMVHSHKSILPSGSITIPNRVHSDAEKAVKIILLWTHNKFPHVLMGPKWPLTRPTSSSKTLCQKRVSNLPCRADVVVTLMASCPPPKSTYRGDQQYKDKMPPHLNVRMVGRATKQHC